MDDIFLQSESPGFSRFRGLIDRWDYAKQLMEQEDAITKILDRHGLILFFKRGSELFGAPEESRLIFAKLKTDTEDDPMQPGFRKEARFPAINLMKCLEGEDENGIESVFSLKDLPKINVCDREKAIEMMMANKK
jgi:hypothetical protein